MIFRVIATAATLLISITIPFVGIAFMAGLVLGGTILVFMPRTARNCVLADVPVIAHMAFGLGGLLCLVLAVACIQWVTWETGRNSTALLDAVMHGPSLPGFAWAAIVLGELAGVQVSHAACIGAVRFIHWRASR